MSSFALDEDQVPVDVRVDDQMIRVTFSGGLELATPVSQSTRLKTATPEQRANWTLTGRGYGIHWPDVDEDLSVRGLFATTRRLPESAVEQIPPLISDLMKTTGRLNRLFKGRPFTPDGHLIGSIGEVVAEYVYGLTLEPCSTPFLDARAGDGRSVQVKLTGEKGGSYGLRWNGSPECLPDLLLCMKLDREGFREVYNGPFPLDLLQTKKLQRNGQVQLRLRELCDRNPGSLPQIRDYTSVNRWFTPELAEVA